MVTTRTRADLPPEVVRKTRVETTYEYVPILGEVLGWWRRAEEMRLGETIEIHLKHSLESYDRIKLNGEYIWSKEPPNP